VKKLAIKEVAEQTGVAAGTIRMWEQRYGFPEPARTSAGYRVYTEEDVVALRRVVAYRSRGLSVPAALERARSILRTHIKSNSSRVQRVAASALARTGKVADQRSLCALSQASEESIQYRH